MKKINIFHTYYAHKHMVLTTNVLGNVEINLINCYLIIST